MSIKERKTDVELAYGSGVELFAREVRDNGDVCDNCYRLLFEEFKRNYARRYDNDNDELYYEEIEAPPERDRVHENLEEHPGGLFCRCGSDGGAQVDERPRDKTAVSHHAHNLAKTLRLLGFDIDERKLVNEAVALKEQAFEGELMDDSFAVAVDRVIKDALGD